MNTRHCFIAAMMIALGGCPSGTEEVADGPEPSGNGGGDAVVLPSQFSCEDTVCRIKAPSTDPIVENVTLTADKQWILEGGVFVGNDADETVLTVEPGTTIYGETSSKAFLVITRGSKIEADGTKDAPIVLTSSKAAGERARGDWGGLVINGKATINGCDTAPCEAAGEGGSGNYGGSDDSDSSGTLRYVRVEFAGHPITEDNELNGIAFQAVGSATTLEYIQVHMADDDGIEFFGGTAQFKYVLTTGIADDNLDWTDGWRGKGQFFIAQQYSDDGDNGIEADNNGDANAAMPRSNPNLSNLSLIGSPDSSKSDIGMLLREGTGASISNALVLGWNDACIDIDHTETWDNGQPSLSHSVVNCNKAFKQEDYDCEEGEDDFPCPEGVEDGDPKEPWVVADWFTNASGNTVVDWDDAARDAVLISAFSEESPNFAPKADGEAVAGADVPSDGFFSDVNFRGAVDPSNDWTQGWTTSSKN
ncbi:MAG: hypothetical protein VX834_08770 [Myxococcota bacterium]|nr:hypothetical protein [Myxococcota bacterium]